jgi:hypothetical protein
MKNAAAQASVGLLRQRKYKFYLYFKQKLQKVLREQEYLNVHSSISINIPLFVC